MLGRLRPQRERATVPALEQGTVITLRIAAADEAAVERLAALSGLEGTRLGRSLVAEVDGEARAALSLVGGTLAADPFHPAAELASLLALRSAQLGGGAAPPPAA